VAHAIEMFFDDEADAAVRRLWRRLADAGLPSLETRSHRRHRPHVSLTVTESVDAADLAPLKSVLAGRRPTLSLYSLAVFPGGGGVILLAVPVTAELLSFHAEVHRSLTGQPVEHWSHYLPGHWVPHCTLAQDEAMTPAEAGRAITVLDGYEPVTATVTSVGVTDTATGNITPLTPA